MIHNKINLVFFLPNFSEGGAGKSILKICNLMNENYFNITIISIGKCYYKSFFKKNIKILQLPQKKTFFSFIDISKILKNYQKRNTIFISNINYANVLSCIFIKLILNYKLVLVERTPLKELDINYNFKDVIKKKIIYLLMRYLYRYADLVIVNSQFTKKLFKKKIKCNLKLIYSPSIDKIKLCKDNKINNYLKIITIGRLSCEKRHDFLINAISYLKKMKLKVVILGNGSLKKKLFSMIKSEKLSKIIKIKSFNKKNLNLLKWSNLYINTSDFEGLPNSVVEAINESKFILSRDSGGGINDIIINNLTGKIISPDKPKTLAEEIKKFVSVKNRINKNKNKNKNIIKKKLNSFLSKNVSKEYEKIFLKLRNEKKN